MNNLFKNVKKIIPKLLVVLLATLASAIYGMQSKDKELYSAIASGQISVVKQLVNENKVLIEQVYAFGYTPIMIALWNGEIDIANFLIQESNVNVINKKDEQGRTALDIALQKSSIYLTNINLLKRVYDYFTVANNLIHAGADVNVNPNLLLIALSSLEIVKEKKASKEFIFCKEVVKEIIKKADKKTLDFTDENGATPLKVAIKIKDNELQSLLHKKPIPEQNNLFQNLNNLTKALHGLSAQL